MNPWRAANAAACLLLIVAAVAVGLYPYEDRADLDNAYRWAFRLVVAAVLCMFAEAFFEFRQAQGSVSNRMEVLPPKDKR